MTAEKQKAIELVRQFHGAIDSNNEIFWNITIDAKKCAKIAIDEIIKACECNNVESWNTDWWNKVKSEIDLLPEYIEEIE